VIESLIDKCNKIFIGGGMIFTFYRAMGLSVGKSMVEEEFIPMAKSLMDKAKAKGVMFYLPEDVIIADEFKADANSKTVSVQNIPDGWMGLDIGAASLAAIKTELLKCKTVVWNGPMVRLIHIYSMILVNLYFMCGFFYLIFYVYIEVDFDNYSKLSSLLTYLLFLSTGSI